MVMTTIFRTRMVNALLFFYYTSSYHIETESEIVCDDHHQQNAKKRMNIRTHVQHIMYRYSFCIKLIN